MDLLEKDLEEDVDFKKESTAEKTKEETEPKSPGFFRSLAGMVMDIIIEVAAFVHQVAGALFLGDYGWQDTAAKRPQAPRREEKAAEKTRENKPKETPSAKEKTPEQTREEQAVEVLKKYHYQIVPDKELDAQGIVKLSIPGRDGEEKESYLSKDALRLSEEELLKEVNKTGMVNAAQRYLDYGRFGNLRITHIGETDFLLERPGGLRMKFPNEMLEKQMKAVGIQFTEMEETGSSLRTDIADDMVPVLTPATIAERNGQKAESEKNTEVSEEQKNEEMIKEAAQDTEDTERTESMEEEFDQPEGEKEQGKEPDVVQEPEEEKEKAEIEAVAVSEDTKEETAAEDFEEEENPLFSSAEIEALLFEGRDLEMAEEAAYLPSGQEEEEWTILE